VRFDLLNDVSVAVGQKRGAAVRKIFWGVWIYAVLYNTWGSWVRCATLCNGFRTTRPESTTSGRVQERPTPICRDFSGSAAIDFDSRLPLMRVPKILTTSFPEILATSR
jgi:hypothetical protein